jgi:hypothetical protein
VVLAEAAIVLLVFFITVFGMIDIGLGVYRHNALSHAARQAVRLASVHGSLAPSGWDGGPWGPSPRTTNADASDPVANVVRPVLGGSDPATTSILVEWPSGSNEVGRAVRATVSTTYQPLLTSLFGGTINFRASATMLITH